VSYSGSKRLYVGIHVSFACPSLYGVKSAKYTLTTIKVKVNDIHLC
jgi:hypothetical protein